MASDDLHTGLTDRQDRVLYVGLVVSSLATVGAFAAGLRWAYPQLVADATVPRFVAASGAVLAGVGAAALVLLVGVAAVSAYIVACWYVNGVLVRDTTDLDPDSDPDSDPDLDPDSPPEP